MELLLIVLVVVVVVGGLAYVAIGRGSASPPEIPTARPKLGGTTVEEAPRAHDAPAVEAGPSDVEVRESDVLEEPDVVEGAVRPTFRERLGRARSTFSGYVSSVLSRTEISDQSYEELEEALILADVGIGPTQELLDDVRAAVKEQKLTTTTELIDVLKDADEGAASPGRSIWHAPTRRPRIWLFVGVNGVGKTTTIGKVGRRLADEGATVVMAAGDTFRAAAAEQLETWANRCGAESGPWRRGG